MVNNNSLNFNESKSSKKSLNLFLSILLVIFIIGAFVVLQVFNYKVTLNDFITSFEDANFSEANNLILTKANSNPLKSIFLEKDLSNYFSSKIDSIIDKVENNEITKKDALKTLTEIKRYNVLDSKVNTTIDSLSTNENFNNALTHYNNNKFKEAYDLFNLVDESDPCYENSKSYIEQCKTNIKSNLLNTVDELCKKDYYSKALSEIDSYIYIFKDDSELTSKIDDINKLKSDYISKVEKEKQAKAASASAVNTISVNTINSLGLESRTPYLIHVDIANQKTNVYNGSKNKWNLVQSYDCSTGVQGKETPKGALTIKERGDWFFSEKFKQGGKYWVQFSGDYLFHSLPYDRTKTNIVDYTIGKPASHGCIRLDENHCKWIYDNVPRGSKVIIK